MNDDDTNYDYEVTFTPAGNFGRGLPRNADGTVTVLRATQRQADELAEQTGGTASGPLNRARHVGRGD